MLKHARAAFMMTFAAVTVFGIPVLVCDDCTEADALGVKVLTTAVGWLCVCVATLVEREDW